MPKATVLVALASAMLATLGAAASGDVCQPQHDPEALAQLPFEALAGVALDADAEYRVTAVELVRRPLFNTRDPAEDKLLFRTANRWHIDTSEQVLRAILLFREGDLARTSILAESERVLRGKSFLYDARVFANRACNGAIDVAVVTRDVWSLSPSLGLTRTGGEERLTAGVSDSNLLGTGTALELSYFDNLDRKGFVVGWAEPNLMGSRVGLRLRTDNTDDGSGRHGMIALPFHSLDARRAWELSWVESERRERRFRDGLETAAFRVERRVATASLGWSAGLRHRFASRWRAGFTSEDHRFAPASPMAQLSGGAMHPAAVLPKDRLFAFPWISFERIEDAYVRTRNVSRVRTTEDLFLGLHATAQFGYSPRGDGHFVAAATFRDGWRSRAGADEPGRDTLLYGLNAAGYWNRTEGKVENATVTAWADWRRRHSARFALHVGALAERGWGLPLDRQLLLGGDTGLRGYPNRFQAGRTRLKLTVEERYYSDLYLVRVLRVAAAAFLDMGHASGGVDAEARVADGVLANVGVGLRFESTRTNRDIVYHIDLAHPLTDAPGVEGYQVTLTSKREI
ncbi:MAG: hypothetical protein OXI55_02440 [Gammaproteobacteria bacterium]|nr:hypothetical protein [Gammaproteobacteria bacterium]